MTGKRDMAHSADDDSRNHGTVRVGADDRFVHDFLGSEDDLFGSERSFLLLTDDSPQMSVPIGVSALDVDDCHIRIEGRDDNYVFAAIWVGDTLDIRVGFLQVSCTGL